MYYLFNNKLKFISDEIYRTTSRMVAADLSYTTYSKSGKNMLQGKGKQPGKGMTEEEVEAFIQKRDEERCKGFWESGHRSMYRHGTCYFFLPNEKGFPNYIWAYLNASPYIDYATKNHKVWISTNMQFLLEHKT